MPIYVVQHKNLKTQPRQAFKLTTQSSSRSNFLSNKTKNMHSGTYCLGVNQEVVARFQIGRKSTLNLTIAQALPKTSATWSIYSYNRYCHHVCWQTYFRHFCRLWKPRCNYLVPIIADPIGRANCSLSSPPCMDFQIFSKSFKCHADTLQYVDTCMYSALEPTQAL